MQKMRLMCLRVVQGECREGRRRHRSPSMRGLLQCTRALAGTEAEIQIFGSEGIRPLCQGWSTSLHLHPHPQPAHPEEALNLLKSEPNLSYFEPDLTSPLQSEWERPSPGQQGDPLEVGAWLGQKIPGAICVQLLGCLWHCLAEHRLQDCNSSPAPRRQQGPHQHQGAGWLPGGTPLKALSEDPIAS